jgi:molybdopterin/thiamine biosynthesis adenylyltransferase/rhodanese-related sulfurtransferase
MTTFKEMIGRVRSQIREISPADARARGKDAVVIDVREADEWAQGHVPGAVFIPRGFLEPRIEDKVPDRGQEVILYCAGGTRSALAARSLQDLGYTNVTSMAGGFGKWKEAGFPIQMPVTLTPEQKQRYSRHLLVPEIGEVGQAKLLASKALLVGAGGLGSPAGLYLAAAGVGTIGVIDSDVVDLSNLQRQILHTNDSVGKPKTESAERTLRALNPDVKVIRHDLRPRLQQRHGRDRALRRRSWTGRTTSRRSTSSTTRPCSRTSRTCYGSIFRFDGQASTFVPRQGPCYRCLFPGADARWSWRPSCDEAGVLGVLPGMIGVVQATEAVKLILGQGPAAHRAAAHVRRARDGVQRVQDPSRSQLRGLRRPSDHQGGHRPRMVVPLRAAGATRRGRFLSRTLTEVSVLESILDAIGNTPLLRLPLAGLPAGAEVWGKCEWFNPGGSVKDRTALSLVTEGEKSGALTAGKVVVDSSSGNTAVGLALVGRAKGYAVELYMPGSVNAERQALCRAYGASIVFTDPLLGSDGALEEVRRRVAADPGRYFYADQYRSPANPLAHYRTTGPEIWEQTGGRVTHFVAGLGTTGTIVGTARYLTSRAGRRARSGRGAGPRDARAGGAQAPAQRDRARDLRSERPRRQGHGLHGSGVRDVRTGPSRPRPARGALGGGGAVGGPRGRSAIALRRGRRAAARQRRALPEHGGGALEDPARAGGTPIAAHARSGLSARGVRRARGHCRATGWCGWRGRSRWRTARTERPAVRYQIAPEDLIGVQRSVRAEGLDIVGYYHSHPDHPARPSERTAASRRRPVRRRGAHRVRSGGRPRHRRRRPWVFHDATQGFEEEPFDLE